MSRRSWSLLLVLMLLITSVTGCINTEDPNKPPEADAGDDVKAEVGELVLFEGKGIDPDEDGSIVKFRWDYDGDGLWDYEGEWGSKNHIYTRPGSYKAKLQVEDDKGATAEDTRWVNVTTSIVIYVAWADGTGFSIRVSDHLDMDAVEVDWTLTGLGPSPIQRTFNLDSGLERVNDTTYGFDPSLAYLAEGQTHVVQVRIGDDEIARRTIEVVNTTEAEIPYTAEYYEEVSDLRFWGQDWTNQYRDGHLVVDREEGTMRSHFSGSGIENSSTNRSGVLTVQNLTLDNLTVLSGWGGDWGQDSWSLHGNGTLEQWGAGGYYIYAWVWDVARAVENGTWTLDDWHRVGVYKGLNETNGTFEWTRTSEGNVVRNNGEGELYEALKIRSVKDFEGTSQGINFTLQNVTTEYDASRAIFDNRTFYGESDQDIAFQNATTGAWRWDNTTWHGFYDSDGDGENNPDVRMYDPEIAARFEGPRPKHVIVGDNFTARNPYGVELHYRNRTVNTTDTAHLQTPSGVIEVTGLYYEAFYNTSWGYVWHWFWVVIDGPYRGQVYEESVLVEYPHWGGGSYRRYWTVESVI